MTMMAKRTTRAVVELLHTAGVKFAVLSKAERCTGDPARRAGNEFLFQQLALENIDTLNGVFSGVPKGQRKIITTCPHCFNTFRNEYPDFDGYFDVFHHTQLLNRLVRDKLLTPIPRVRRTGSRSRTMIRVSWVGTIRCSIHPANYWGPQGLIWWRCRGIVTRVFVAVRVGRACSWRRIWARALMRIGPPRRLLRARRRSPWAARFAIR